MTLTSTEPASQNIVGARDQLVMAVLIIIATVSAVLAYHSMQRPAMPSTTQSGAGWTRPAQVLVCGVSVTFLVLIWWSVLFFILLLTDTPRDGLQTIAITGSSILALRDLAQVRREPAHELSKPLPLTLNTLVLISVCLRAPSSLDEVVDEAAGATSLCSQLPCS